MRLTDLLTRFPDQDPQDDGVLVHCPAHEDSHQSLRLSVSDKGKVLMRCRAGCETPKVLEALGLSMFDLATMEPGEVTFDRATSVDVPASPADVARLAVQLDRYHDKIAESPHPSSEGAILYAQDRFGLDFSTIDRLGLGYAEDLGGGPRLVVPFRDQDGIARGFQARALAPDASVRWLGPESPDGASWSKLAWFPGSSGWDEVLVTEGPGDALTAAALGYDTIGIRGAGLVSNPAVVDTIAGWLGDRVAIIAGDGDVSGRRFSATLAGALVERGHRAKILAPPDTLDLTDWRQRDGDRFAIEIVRAIQSADEVTSTTATLSARDLERYPLTDLGNARYCRDYIAGRGSGVRYSPEAGFFLLDEGVWRPDKLDRTRAYAQEAADTIAKIAKALSQSAGTDGTLIREAKAWSRWAHNSQSSQGLAAALRELQALPDVAADVNDFDRFPELLACRNGVVNLRTGRLQPHDPKLLLTRRVELDFEPSARAPRWEAFLREVFPSHADSLPDYMRRLIGYGITGSTAEQCFAVLWGTGANGKSVFTDTLTEVFRELTVTTPFSTFEERASGGIPNDLASLKGSRLVMAAEGEQGRPMAEAVLKRVTGRDLISARFMRKEFFEFRPTFLLLLASNFKPSFRGQDEGLWRRVKLIPWERYFAPSERDHKLGDALLSEAAGIFAWAVRGAGEWFTSGLGDPPVIMDSTKEYRETSDALSGFLPGIFEKDAGSPRRVAGKVLFDAYLQWADDENLPGKERWTRKAFYAALEERGAVKRHDKVGIAFEGLRRARATRSVADHDAPEEDPLDERVAAPLRAYSPPDLETPTVSRAEPGRRTLRRTNGPLSSEGKPAPHRRTGPDDR